jgi:hypothetical protein
MRVDDTSERQEVDETAFSFVLATDLAMSLVEIDVFIAN